MINDPLLPPPPPPAPRSNRKPSVANTRTAPARAKHPAMSARILATGLAATGTLGLTAGYAVGARAQSQPTTLDNVALADSSQSVAPLSPAAPQQSAGSQAAPQQSPGRVIQVPVPGISPATPGSSAGTQRPVQRHQAPVQQQSSGSN